ncbi:putative carbonyl reductase [Cadophora sp. DSE1049]|nr:putative carbonyl reductase [Cadophora sp. DSE1049]
MAAVQSTIVLITGSNQGIGFEIAKKLGKDYPSYHILMGSRNPERGQAAAAKLQADKLSVEHITIDVLTDESITAAAEIVSSKFGRLDVLINNAGIGNDKEYEVGKNSIRDVMVKAYSTNVFGAFQCVETSKPLLEKSENPRVVFMSSSLGSFGSGFGQGNWPIYRSTKTAMDMLVWNYAKTYEEKGFKINLCCPGLVATNLTDQGPSDGAESGAINAVRLATLGKDGENGTYSNKEGLLPW